MPISLSQLTANRKACEVTFDDVDGVLHVEYYPQRLTARMVADLVAADPESMKGMRPEQQLQAAISPVRILAELLASWDLTADDDGPVLPIDAATLEGMGVPVLWQILGAILGNANEPGKAPAPTASRSMRR